MQGAVKYMELTGWFQFGIVVEQDINFLALPCSLGLHRVILIHTGLHSGDRLKQS